MANRAYLYGSNNPKLYDLDNWRISEGVDYFDSRHNIPLAWFFLFQPSDLKFIYLSAPGELKVFAVREIALATFVRRRPLLREIISPGFYSEEVVDFFLERLRGWEEEYLLMDPGEIIYDDEGLSERWADVFRAMDMPGFSRSDVVKAVGNHSSLHCKDAEELQLNLTGYCYGK